MSQGTMTNVLVRDILRINGEDLFGLFLFFHLQQLDQLEVSVYMLGHLCHSSSRQSRHISMVFHGFECVNALKKCAKR